MALDPSIILRAGQGVQPIDIAGTMNNVLAIRSAQQRNALADMQMADMRRQAAEQERARARQMAGQNALMQGLQGGRRGADLEADLENQGFFDEADKLRGRRLATEKTAAETGKIKAETSKTTNETTSAQMARLAQSLRNVKDQATYDMAYNFAVQEFGPEAMRNVPAQYDPRFVQMALDATLKQEEALKLAEQARANRAQEANTRRGQNMTDARAREANEINRQAARTQIIQTPDGGVMLVDKGTGRAAQATGADGQAVRIPSAEANTRRREAGEVLQLLDQAETLIPKGTASFFGAGRDFAGRAVGVSGDAADAAAQLKVLQGRLVSLMPKMSGPQSDKDVQLYRDMAGQIGDPTVPVSQKRAAAQTLRELNEKYASPEAVEQSRARAPTQGDVSRAVNNAAANMTGINSPDIQSLLDKYK